MRLLVVIAGLSIGLSGCVGGGIVHRMPAGNETADGSGDVEAGGQAPPWTLTQAGAGNGGDPTFQGAGDGSTDREKKERDQDEDEDEGEEQNGTDPDPGDSNSTVIDDLQDQAPTEGAQSAEELSTSIEETANEGTAQLPKPEDLEDTSLTLPTKFPSVEPDLG